MAEIAIQDEGSLVLFRPLTDDARAFFDEHVASEGWQWFGGALAVERRYAEDLAEALADAGLL